MHADAAGVLRRAGQGMRSPFANILGRKQPVDKPIIPKKQETITKDRVEEYEPTRDEKDARALTARRFQGHENDEENDPWHLANRKRVGSFPSQKPRLPPFPHTNPKKSWPFLNEEVLSRSSGSDVEEQVGPSSPKSSVAEVNELIHNIKEGIVTVGTQPKSLPVEPSFAKTYVDRLKADLAASKAKPKASSQNVTTTAPVVTENPIDSVAVVTPSPVMTVLVPEIPAPVPLSQLVLPSPDSTESLEEHVKTLQTEGDLTPIEQTTQVGEQTHELGVEIQDEPFELEESTAHVEFQPVLAIEYKPDHDEVSPTLPETDAIPLLPETMLTPLPSESTTVLIPPGSPATSLVEENPTANGLPGLNATDSDDDVGTVKFHPSPSPLSSRKTSLSSETTESRSPSPLQYASERDHFTTLKPGDSDRNEPIEIHSGHPPSRYSPETPQSVKAFVSRSPSPEGSPLIQFDSGLLSRSQSPFSSLYLPSPSPSPYGPPLIQFDSGLLSRSQSPFSSLYSIVKLPLTPSPMSPRFPVESLVGGGSNSVKRSNLSSPKSLPKDSPPSNGRSKSHGPSPSKERYGRLLPTDVRAERARKNREKLQKHIGGCATCKASGHDVAGSRRGGSAGPTCTFRIALQEKLELQEKNAQRNSRSPDKTPKSKGLKRPKSPTMPSTKSPFQRTHFASPSRPASLHSPSISKTPSPKLPTIPTRQDRTLSKHALLDENSITLKPAVSKPTTKQSEGFTRTSPTTSGEKIGTKEKRRSMDKQKNLPKEEELTKKTRRRVSTRKESFRE